ncbi:MAG: tetratricopeptide repeat protein [Myxococcota bacterium]|nr:tetratricopeptide repeat protein [Myxococcota bacterium]MEC8422517.1 tetratricopeptide repeat protein [Myxococcota bacterium]
MSSDTPTEAPVLHKDESHLDGLGQRLIDALEARRKGDIDAASELLRSILSIEPRLAEPRIELASMLLEAEQFDEAEAEAREAARLLDLGGQWTEDVDPGVLRSMAWNLLAEALRRQADQDDVVFGDPDRWQSLMAESREAFAKAASLDPTNEHASHWAFGMRYGAGEE